MKKEYFKIIIANFILFSLIGCGGGKTKISVMPSLDEFQQATNADIKIDILFVIDDSGSMAPVQTNLRNNFESFIGDFYDKGFDFRVAVGKTSAFGTPTAPQSSGVNLYYEASRTVHEFRCGAGNDCGAGPNSYGRACTGTYGNTNTTNGNGTPNIGTDHILSSLAITKTQMINKFKRNADVGLCGDGDERALQSAESILRNMKSVYTGGLQFPRPNTHFAVIHVGDEPDGKWNAGTSSNNSLTAGSLRRGSNNNLTSGFPILQATANPVVQAEHEDVVESYLLALENHEPSATVSVHAIQTLDTGCDSAQFIGHPQIFMANLTEGGMVISICDNFAVKLGELGDRISSLASSFELSEQLDAQGDSTLRVYVEGLNGNNPLPRSSTNGFQYDIITNKVTFFGSMVPPQGALIGVTYTCGTLNCN